MRRFTYYMDWEIVIKTLFQVAMIYAVVLIVHSISLSTWLNILCAYAVVEGLIVLLFAYMLIHDFLCEPVMKRLKHKA
jgi:hypothetical protein